MLNVLIWLTGALVVASAVSWDMRRLRVNRVGLNAPAWWALSVLGWPLVVPAYLLFRPKVRREVIASVWHYVGDANTPIAVRRRRLLALHRNEMVDDSIFEECLKQIDGLDPCSASSSAPTSSTASPSSSPSSTPSSREDA